MKIIEPKVELWQQGNDSKAHVARCARVCYGRESGNDKEIILLVLENIFKKVNIFLIKRIFLLIINK